MNNSFSSFCILNFKAAITPRIWNITISKVYSPLQIGILTSLDRVSKSAESKNIHKTMINKEYDSIELFVFISFNFGSCVEQSRAIKVKATPINSLFETS